MTSPMQRCCVLSATLATLVTPPAAFGGNVPYLVKDINPGPLGSSPSSMNKIGNRLFFNADDGVHGQELWVSDGTDAGTYMVIDLVPGADGSVPQTSMADLAGIAVFHADNNDDGYDVYRSDGTADGTTWIGEVNDAGDPIQEGSCTFSLYRFREAGGIVFFMGKNAVNQESLWRTDGTAQNTTRIRDNININEMEPVGSTLFFVGSASGQTIPGFDLWKSDGTPFGTIRLKDLSGAINLTPSNGRLFFAGQGSGSDEELWISDGTPEGTFLVKDINPGPNPSTPLEFADINGTIYFTAFSLGFGREIWKSDGTESGTQMLIDLVPGSGSGGAYGLTNVDGVLFFARFDSLQGWQLWKSDGTAPGTVLIKTIAPPDLPSKNAPSSFSSSHGKLYFSADDGVHEEELWVSDGESAGTYMVADLDVGPSGSSPVDFQTIGTLLYFAAGANQGQELWCLDTRSTIPALPSYGLTILGLFVVVGGVVVLIRRNRMISFNGKESHEIH